MLVLFDIDGTLLKLPSLIHDRAIELACADLFDVRIRVPEDEAAQHLNGLTTPMLARRLLASAGLSEEVRTAAWKDWPAAMARAFESLQETLPGQHAFADAPSAIDRLVQANIHVGLLTGNYLGIAQLKLRAAGVWRDEIDLQQGAFGDDADDRDQLGRVARGRADRMGMHRVVIVGDTPRDIRCARAASALAVAVTTGVVAADKLIDADVIVDSLTDLADHLLAS